MSHGAFISHWSKVSLKDPKEGEFYTDHLQVQRVQTVDKQSDLLFIKLILSGLYFFFAISLQ